MPEGFVQVPIPFEPGRCPLVQLRDFSRIDLRLDLTQKIGKQRTVAEPLVFPIQSRKEEIGMLQAIQHDGAVSRLGIRVDHRFAQWAVETL